MRLTGIKWLFVLLGLTVGIMAGPTLQIGGASAESNPDKGVELLSRASKSYEAGAYSDASALIDLCIQGRLDRRACSPGYSSQSRNQRKKRRTCQSPPGLFECALDGLASPCGTEVGFGGQGAGHGLDGPEFCRIVRRLRASQRRRPIGECVQRRFGFVQRRLHRSGEYASAASSRSRTPTKYQAGKHGGRARSIGEFIQRRFRFIQRHVRRIGKQASTVSRARCAAE